MPKKLTCKYCNICGIPVLGIKRKDRNAYHYPPRCTTCSRKAFDPEVIATKLRVISEIRKPSSPIGATRIHKSKENLHYIVIKVAEPNVWKYEHRVITNAKSSQQVHHINGNTLDNRLENLVLLSPKEHRIEHGLQQKWSRAFESCVECKSTLRKHLSLGLCTACYQRLKYISTK